MTYLVGAIFVLNAIDAVATVTWVSADLAYEANPLMAHLLDIHPVLFVATKLTLVGLSVWLLWRHCDRMLSMVAAIALFGLYYALIVYHLSFPSYLAWSTVLG
ncbi:hypothetical protein FIV42_16630 [Persicimonas caeni]|uniref:DUF5658 domain-containing protein n=1 Tax=Persicimonas caeni TaxID=2292766 RepID=A0A4Y6PVC1_PERCE|nr:DUF5658 family protein [Persicimonas caeni]QDG52304.1 hypothetical protein FIV42_16630 [Persicimonas caeni]QED33526.1 hypothetical protein FRD00_16625 [Persicimonas caeni]